MSSTVQPARVAEPRNLGHAPGTVLLEDVRSGHHAVLLQPQPSDDPNDPLNWSQFRKFLNFFIAAFYTMMITALLNISPIIWQDYNTELGISYPNLNNAFAVNCAGLAVGCLIFIPFALKYGRRPVYIVSTAITFITAIWQALLRDLPNMMATQAISGMSGAVCDVVVQMTVADVFFLHQRGTMNALYLFFFAAGGFLAPIAAGFIANQEGWPWVYWWCAIFLGIITVVCLFCYEETKYTVVTEGMNESSYFPTREAGLSGLATDQGEGEKIKENPRDYELRALISVRVLNPSIPSKTYWQRMAFATTTDGDLKSFIRHIYQPLIVVCSFPAVAYTALQYGAMLAWFSVLVTTESTYFSTDPYNFNTSNIGLLNLAPFIGGVFATLYSGVLSDWTIQLLAKRNNGVYEPEMRLYLAVVPALVMPGGLFLYGYSLAKGAHWIIPCIGAALFGFGQTSISGLSLTYLVDSYREIIGDALVGVAFVRNAFSAGIVFAISPWIESIGFHDTVTSVGCLSLAISLLFIPMIVWGKKMRIACASRYAYYASLQFDSRATI